MRETSLFIQIERWINDRWPLTKLIRLALDEEMPGGASFAYIFGSSTLIVFLFQIVTGILQLFYYVPTIDHAYDSVSYLITEVPFGWLIHSLHYWGATFMVILVGLHMCQVFIWGAYKNPRQLTWLVGVANLLITLGISFIGPTLHWDELGYWAASVGTNIAGTVPWAGDLVKRLLRGGEVMGQLTLSRFFVLHIAILPGILLGTIGIHLVAFRHFGITGPWTGPGNKKKVEKTGSFWPDQVFYDTMIVILLVFLLITLSVYTSAPIDGPADPLDSSYVPKPEWNFLFLYQALKFFHGKLEPIGTVGIPLFIVCLFALLPFLDRGQERSPARRPFFMAGGLVFVFAILTLAYFGYSSPGPVQGPVQGPAVSQTPSAPAAPFSAMSTGVRQGSQLFQSHGCTACHRVNGIGGTVGPDLSNESLKGKSREWLITQIRDPKSHFPKTIMPAFTSLTDQELNALIDYLQSFSSNNPSPATTTTPPATGEEKPASMMPYHAPPSSVGKTESLSRPPGRAVTILGSSDHGGILFKQTCESCHGPRGTDKVPNPGSDDRFVPPLNPIDRALFSKDPGVFAENIDRFIQHGSVPEGPNPALQMMAFGETNTLTQQQISNIEAYILHLNGIDRVQIVHPGIEPHHFFFLTVVVFILTGLGLTGLWIRGTRKEMKNLNLKRTQRD